MKMAVSVESVGVLRDSIANSISSSQENNENIANKIIAIAKKILLTKIEYEEVNNYDQSVLDVFKSKYTVLKPFNNGKLMQNENGFEKSNQNCSVHLQSYQQQVNQKYLNELPQAKRILFPRDSVQVGWRSSGRKWQIGSGMMNVGNTCYLNSTLQAIFHVPAMANWLISDSEHREDCRNQNGMQDGCIICAMAKTLISSQISSSAIRPQLVYSRLKQICKHLIFGRQEDAHEFLRYLVEAMEKSYLQRYKNSKELDQYSKETTPLNQILGGYLKTSVRCLSCGHVSTTFQHFQDFLLDIRKPNTIEEALDGYFAKERLEDMGYKCESCKKKVSAIKQFTLERAPISLCIQLKRFSMVGTKINKYIAIRSRLDLTKYATNKNGNETLSYKLVAMVTHLGASQHCGHYTAIGLTEQGYYQFDDSCVRPISLPNVLNTNAYIIFYELDENQPSKPVCTQVSGENSMSKNIENIDTQEKGNANASTSFNENLNINSNGLFNSKTPTKFDFSATRIGEKVLNSSFVNNNLIGPQIPSENLKNLKNMKNNESDEISKTQTVASSGINYDKSNSFTNKSTDNISPLSKLSTTNSNKLLIQFKNSTSDKDLSLSAQKPTENRGNNFENSTTIELVNSKSFNGSSKIVNGKSPDSIESKINGNFLIIDNLSKKEEKACDELKKSFLPSMPKLDSNSETTTTVDCGHQNNRTPTKQNIPWMGPVSPNFLMKQNSQNGIEIKTVPVHNGNKTSHIKSLVPYEYDADEDLSDNSSDDEIVNEKPDLEVKNHNGEEFIKHNGVIKKENFSTSNETSPDASPDAKRIKSNPPSPHVVKTKAGLWQVTPITPNGSPKAEIEIQMLSPEQNFTNPFSVSIPPSSFYSDTTYTNGNNFYTKKDEKSSTVKELTKFSHRGYGASVLSWNGTKSEMELVVNEEAREERKRQLEDEEENDIDRGRQKKIKTNGNYKQNDPNPGYNPFQEQQLQKNSEHNRQNWMSNNRALNKVNSTNRYNYQNNCNSNYNFDMLSNSNNKGINYSYKTMNGKNNINNKNSNKFSIINKNTSINNSKNNHNHKSISNSKNIKNNCKINSNNNCFYRNEVNNNYNDNNGSKNGYQYNPFLNRNGNSNFFRRHNHKKFSSNRVIHQKNGDWR